MTQAYEVLIEIAKYAPVRLNVTDTCPTCPGGWRDRPGSDHHTAKQAADFALPQNDTGQRAMRDFARWMHQYSGYLLELIHTTPYDDDNGFYVKNGKKVSESFYGAATSAAHVNHVHVAADLGQAQKLLAKLKASGEPRKSISKKAATKVAKKAAPKKSTSTARKSAAKKAGPKKSASRKAAAASGLASSYTIQPGDTLSAIATRFGVTVDGIRKLNPAITDPNLITAGDVLKMM